MAGQYGFMPFMPAGDPEMMARQHAQDQQLIMSALGQANSLWQQYQQKQDQEAALKSPYIQSLYKGFLADPNQTPLTQLAQPKADQLVSGALGGADQIMGQFPSKVPGMPAPSGQMDLAPLAPQAQTPAVPSARPPMTAMVGGRQIQLEPPPDFSRADEAAKATAPAGNRENMAFNMPQQINPERGMYPQTWEEAQLAKELLPQLTQLKVAREAGGGRMELERMKEGQKNEALQARLAYKIWERMKDEERDLMKDKRAAQRIARMGAQSDADRRFLNNVYQKAREARMRAESEVQKYNANFQGNSAEAQKMSQQAERMQELENEYQDLMDQAVDTTVKKLGLGKKGK